MFFLKFIERFLKSSFSVCEGCYIPSRDRYCEDCRKERGLRARF